MDSSDHRRLSVSLVDVSSGHDADFLTIATHFEALLIRKEYGRAEMIRDEAHPLRFYAVRRGFAPFLDKPTAFSNTRAAVRTIYRDNEELRTMLATLQLMPGGSLAACAQRRQLTRDVDSVAARGERGTDADEVLAHAEQVRRRAA